MANINITIRDVNDGKVEVICNPSFEEIIKKHAAGEGLKPSHGYALNALNAIRHASKTGDPFKVLVNLIKGDNKNGLSNN